MATLLIESSWIINLLRQKQDVPLLLQSQLRAKQLVTCGTVRAEVLRGVINRTARDDLAAWFDRVPEVPVDDIWCEVSDLAWGLDRRGIVLPLPDLIIAACARRAGAAVLTVDNHFHHIPGLTVHRILP